MSRPKIVATYDYRNLEGELIHQTVRYQPKSFKQRRPDGKKWIWNLDDVDLILYNLEIIVKSKQIIICEGEKDADALIALGLPATTCAMGAGKWQKLYNKYIEGKDIVLLPHNDAVGRKSMEDIAISLNGKVKCIRIVGLSDVPAEGGDVSDYLDNHSKKEFLVEIKKTPILDPNKLIENRERYKNIKESIALEATILDAAPPVMRCPIALIDGRAYVATWIDVEIPECDALNDKGKKIKLPKHNERRLFVMRDDAEIFIDGCKLKFDKVEAKSLDELPFDVFLSETPPLDRVLSGRFLKKYRDGYRVDPIDIFDKIVKTVDQFIDFSESIGPQQTMCRMIACYTISTYLTAGFSVIGFIWPNGNKGSGKTKLCLLVTELAYLGQMVLAGGSFASLRDMADYGATIAFDDAENIDKMDNDKKALLLAGNRKGATVSLKIQAPGGGWQTVWINVFCPRLFSAISLPHEVLASRTIIVPLIPTLDRKKANLEVMDSANWIHERGKLMNDLWLLALEHLSKLPALDKQVTELSRLTGRNLEPWRAILAVALWLQKCGIKGLFDEMNSLSVDYQKERSGLETDNIPSAVAKAICQLVEKEIDSRDTCDTIYTCDTLKEGNTRFKFYAKEVTEEVRNIIKTDELDIDVDKISSTKVGIVMSKMRLKKNSDRDGKYRTITLNHLQGWRVVYNLTLPESVKTLIDSQDIGVTRAKGVKVSHAEKAPKGLRARIEKTPERPPATDFAFGLNSGDIERERKYKDGNNK